MTTQQQYAILRKELNEQQWRLYLGTEALKLGYGGISQVAEWSGADWKTVQRGGQRAQGRASESGGEGAPSGRREEEGDGDGSELTKGPRGVAGAQRGSDELDQMDDALADAPGQGALPAGTSHQEDGVGRRAARAGVLAQGE